jgi:hypothetical protein
MLIFSDDASLEDAKNELRSKMAAQSSKVKWMDTNHCRDSFDGACQFTEMAGFRLNCKGFKLFDFSTIEGKQSRMTSSNLSFQKLKNSPAETKKSQA